MTDLLYRIFEISIQASVLTLAVLVLRILFKKAPKSWRCALWGLVALRLLLPFSLQSPVSLQPDTAPMRSSMEAYFSAAEEAIPNTPNGEIEYASPAIPNTPKGEAEQIAPTLPALSQTEQHTSAAPSFFARIELPQILMFVWLSGIALLLIYAGISYLLLRRKTAAALRLKDNVFLIDEIPSPFVLGVLRPRICLPDALPEAQREHVIAHEQAHIRRGDHVLKPLAFLLASVYWFNPVLWLGYVLFSRDLELACDERVIRGYGPAQRAAYAETLLTCGRAKRSAALSPLAFGEVGVKTRVKQALSYKKPALWILVAAVLAAVVAAVCFLTEPKTGEPAQISFSKETVPLFSSFSPEKISDDYTVLDVTEQYVLASISPIFEGANTDLVGGMYPNRTSRTALVSLQTGEIVCEWDLRDEDLRCYAGAITDDGVILNCLKADKTYSAQSLQYQLRKYAFDQKAVILDEGSCVGLGSAERISKDQYLYVLRFRTEESQKLCLREMDLKTGTYESYDFDLPEGDILDENIRYENGAYLYSVMRLGGKNNLFYYAAKGKAPHLIRFSEEEQPLECTLLNGRILAQTHEKASDRPGYYTWLYVYNTKGVLLNKIKYGEEQQHPQGLSYLCSGSGFCLTVSSQVYGYQDFYNVMPIVIEKDKPVCLDFLGYGAYAQFVDGGDFVLVYNIRYHTCERYRLQKTE